MARILVIDDDRDFVDMTRRVLEAAEFDMDEALTPESALERLRAETFDLVILDVMMPAGYEGFEVARAIREDLDKRELPILILTAVHETKQVPYRFAPDKDYLPVDVFLDKPASPELLVNTVKEMLGELREHPEYPL